MGTINVLSNEADQAPKNTNTRYQARIDAMNDEIKEAFDTFVDIDTNETLNNWLVEKYHILPFQKMNQLKEGQNFSIQIKREKSENQQGNRNKTIGILKDPKTISSLKGSLLSQSKEPLQPWETWTYLVIKRNFNDPKFENNKKFEIHIEQIQIPDKSTFIPKWLVFHNKPEGSELDKILKDINI